MGTAEGISVMMTMYEDESVEISYRHGAQLQLSPCGSEFVLVKATDPHGHPLQPTERVRQRTRFTISAYKELLATALAFRNKYASRPYLPEELISAENRKPEQMYQSTTVIQHHSCFAVDSTWAYPLSLARHHWTSHLSNSNNTTPEEDSKSRQADEGMNISDKNHKDRDSQLPQALPLTCPSPHLHRWKIKDSLHADEVSALPTELVKILWCQGVTYRILSGEVPVVEVSLGDGSVIRSNGVLNSYFTHHKPKLQSEEGSEITYHLSSLPPGVPGQLYPVGSIVSRASRILVCYNQAKHLLKFPTTSTCLQQDKHISKTTLSEQNLSSEVFVEKLMKMPQTAGSLSDVVAAELEKIKRFNVLLENNHLLRSESEPRNSEGTSSKITQDESVHEDYIAEALQRTSETIKEIDALISATTLN
ncbi:uncharacterized protein C5orf34 homolog isoform 4-T4 [Anableps anableps]